MAKRKELLKNKLSALNPGIPTNTRGSTAVEKAVQPPLDAPADTRDKAAAASNVKAAAKSDIKVESRKKPATVSPPWPGPESVPKADIKDTPKEEKRPAF